MNIGTKKEENLQKSYNFFEDEIAKKQAVIKSVIIQLETIGECANLTTIRSRMHVCTVTTNKTIVQRFDEYMYSKLTKVAWLIYMRSNQLRWVCKLNSVRSFFSSISNLSFFLKDSTLKSFFEQDQGSVKGGDLRSRLYTLDRFLSLSTFAFQS